MKNPTHVATHHVMFDQPGYRLARALCGRLIFRAESVGEPTCPDCLRALEDLDGGNLPPAPEDTHDPHKA